MPEISIIIPVYNGEEYLKEAINSVRNQTIKPFEIIIINDDSIDKTKEIINKFVEYNWQSIDKYSIKDYSNEKNMGIGFSRAKGVDLAQGDFIAFCSADDVLNPNFIEAMLSYVRSYPDCIFYSDFEVIDKNGNKTGEIRSPEFNDYNQFVQACINAGKRDKMFVCYNIFAPAKLLKENNFDSEKTFGEDLEHLLRCILIKNIKFVHVPFILFKYREHRKMFTQQKWNEIHQNNLNTFEKINSLMGKPIL